MTEQIDYIARKIKDNYTAKIEKDFGAQSILFTHRKGFDALLVSDYKAFANSLRIKIQVPPFSERSSLDYFSIAAGDEGKLKGVDITDDPRVNKFIGNDQIKPELKAEEKPASESTPEKKPENIIVVQEQEPAQKSFKTDRNFKKPGDPYSTEQISSALFNRPCKVLGVDSEKGPIIDLCKYKEPLALALEKIPELKATLKPKGAFFEVTAHGFEALKYLQGIGIRIQGAKGLVDDNAISSNVR